MAADKPVVSTPIADVAELYGDVVRIAADAERRSCARATSCSPEADEARAPPRRRHAPARRSARPGIAPPRRSRDRLEQSAGEGLRDEARALLAGGIAAPRSRGGSPARGRVPRCSAPARRACRAAYHFGSGAMLLERERTGGRLVPLDRGSTGFTFDYAGHIMFSNEPYVHELYQMLLGDNVHWQDREAWIYSKGVYTRYPFQGALYGLPPDVIKECIVGAIEARFGAARPATAAPQCSTKDCCADGTDCCRRHARRRVRAQRPTSQPRNFEEFIYEVWGAGIAKHFAIPYNRKLWAFPLTEMETSWLGGRVPLPDLEEMIEGALKPAPKPMGPNARFGYPLRGGFQALMDGFLPHLKGPLELDARDRVGVEPRQRTRDAGRRPQLSATSADQHDAAARAGAHDRRRGAGRGARRGRAAAARLRALREPRRRPREHHREALDLLPRGHGVPPHLRAGQRQPALQSAGRLRADLRDHLLAGEAAALRRRRR